MKSLKFAPHLIDRIMTGEKTSTWRLFDDKDLQQGDRLTFINKETGKEFGTALITLLYTKTLGALEDVDWIGHEKFNSETEMYHTYHEYYGEKVTPETEVKIIKFDFLEASHALVYKGIIIENSLRDTSILASLTKEKSWVDGDWKLHSVLVSPNQITQISQALADGPWYTHFWIPGEKTIKVVFRDRVFDIDSTKKETWKTALEYGRTLGIPEEQLDFPIE